MKRSLFTIGHSTHSERVFLELLRQHDVTSVVDVRSQPYSRFTPQFNREILVSALKGAGMAYAFVGRELGARTRDRNCYVDGKVDYVRLASTDLFHKGMARIEQAMETDRIALMCAEKDPLTCHRAILIARRLNENGVEVQHILETGDLESHEAAIARLLNELKLPSHDLFWSDEDFAAEAYRRRGEQIAHVQRAENELLVGEL